MDMLNIVREEAAKTYTNESDLNAFVEGFEKQAAIGGGLMTRLLSDPVFMGALYKGGVGLGAGLIGAGVLKGITSTSSAITNNALKSKYESSLQFVRNNNKIVRNGNPTKVQSYADTLFSFAPHVASDPNILSSLLANAVLGEGIDPMTIKSIADLENRYKENISPSPLLGIRT